MYLLADRLLKRGVKLDGLGLQFHLYGKLEDAIRMEIKSFFDPAHILQVLDQLGKLPLPLHISEISLPTYPELPRELAEEIQAQDVRLKGNVSFMRDLQSKVSGSVRRTVSPLFTGISAIKLHSVLKVVTMPALST